MLCCGELWLAKLATLHAENTPSFSSFFARGKARTWAFFWLARCCWLSPGLAGSLFADPEPVAAVLEPADPEDWTWRSRGCKACAAGSDMSTLLNCSSSAPVYLICCLQVLSAKKIIYKDRTQQCFEMEILFWDVPIKIEVLVYKDCAQVIIRLKQTFHSITQPFNVQITPRCFGLNIPKWRDHQERGVVMFIYIERYHPYSFIFT